MSARVRTGTTVVHPNGQTFVVGSCAEDDAERMNCDKAGQAIPGYTMCGRRDCCGWPLFLGCPCVYGAAA